MDIDFLTPMAYDCIYYAFETADQLQDELSALCEQFETEDQCLRGMLDLLAEIEQYPQGYLVVWELAGKVNQREFRVNLTRLRKRIETTLETPYLDRGGDYEDS